MRINFCKNVFISLVLIGTAASCFANDADIKLTTNTGATKFTVQDSNTNVLFSVTSTGTVTISSNTVLRGATFYSNAPAQISTATIQIFQATLATLRALPPTGAGLLYYCTNCASSVCVSTGIVAGSFAAIASTKAICQ